MRGPVRSLNGFALVVSQLLRQKQKRSSKYLSSRHFLRQPAKQRKQLKFLDESLSGLASAYQHNKQRTELHEMHHVESYFAKRNSQRRKAYQDVYARMFFALVACLVEQGYRLEPLAHRALELAVEDLRQKGR